MSITANIKSRTPDKPRWIVFDVGAVLLDWPSSATATAKQLGVSPDELLKALFTYAPRMFIGEIKPLEGWRRTLKLLGSKEDPAKIINLWSDRKFWLKDTLKLARELHAAGYRLAILTNSWLGLADPSRKPFLPEELGLFEHIVDSSIEGVKKPNPAIFRTLEETIGAKGSYIFFIDDDRANIPPAEKLGWQTFSYKMGGNNRGRDSNRKLRSLLLG